MASLRAAQVQLLTNSAFLDQVAGSLVFAAFQVINESPATTNHQNRAQFANAIFLNPQNQARILAPGILTNPTISAQAATPALILDNDIDFVVASLFDIYATRNASNKFLSLPQLAR